MQIDERVHLPAIGERLKHVSCPGYVRDISNERIADIEVAVPVFAALAEAVLRIPHVVWLNWSSECPSVYAN